MKKAIFFIAGLFFLMYCNNSFSKNPEQSSSSLTLKCSPDLYVLTSNWVAEFQKTHPNQTIQLNITNPGETINNGGLYIISNDKYANVGKDNSVNIVVGRNAIVPITNAKNPYLAILNQKGITTKNLATVISDAEKQTWGTLLTNQEKSPVHLYLVQAGSASSLLSEYLNLEPTALLHFQTVSPAEMISIVKKDPLALGFCTMTDVLDLKNQNLAENIQLVPIDRNANQILDYNEKIYDSWAHFLRGVWIGKYPKALCQNIYAVSAGNSDNETQTDFLKWILTDGQQYLTAQGYCDLVSSDRQSKLAMLDKNNETLLPNTPVISTTNNILITIIGLIIIGMVVAILIQTIRQRRNAAQHLSQHHAPVFNEKSVKFLNGLFFDKTHTWAFMEKDGQVKVGMDDFLQHITGPLTRIKMKDVGESVTKGEAFLSIIQDGKQLNIYAPVSGIIKAHNDQLLFDSTLLNSSPYSSGWVYMIEPTNWIRETQFLFMADRYQEWIKNEFSRVKDFVTNLVQSRNTEFSPVILQDGGELSDNILAGLGPEVWEDFQIKFINPSR